MANELQIVQDDIQAVQTLFMSTLSSNNIKFEKECEFAMQAMTNNSSLLKAAINNRQSMRDAIVNVSALGISLNPALKDAYLVPRDGKVCLDISYMGLLNIAIDTGAIRWRQAKLVHANDTYEVVGVDKEPIHKREPFGNRGEVVGAYCVVKTPDGDYLSEEMSVNEINLIRDSSATWKKSDKREHSPWAKHWGEMAKKTVIKRAYKFWPKTDKGARLESAIHLLNTENGEGFSNEKHSNDDPRPVIEYVQTINSKEGLDAYWKSIARRFAADTPERKDVIAAFTERKQLLLNVTDARIVENTIPEEQPQ